VIDFRYHLVSIVSVFLALAIGLVVGSTALSGKAEEALQAAHAAVAARNATLVKEKGLLSQQVAADQAFAQAASQRLLGGVLAGEKVVLVVAPGAANAVTTGVTAALKRADATVTGQVDLQPAFLTTSGQNEDALSQLAQSLAAKEGLSPPTQSSSQVAGQQEAGQVIAASLLTRANGVGLSGKASQAILTGFGQAGFLSAGPTTASATLAVLVTPGGPPPQTGGQALVAVAQELKAAGSGVVMAGEVASIGANSVINSENLAPTANQVSTVDYADTETGQIMVVWALRFALDGKAPAPYGAGPAAAPSPAPSPSPTLTSNSLAVPGRHA
jgi:hypothetical protein